MFDIANFYDSIDLRRLETMVRAVGNAAHFHLNVVFHLLRTWNRAHCLYTDSTKGLPMDVVGDCSRLLANFFLTPFDARFRGYLQERGADYTRFADDMVIRADSKADCAFFVYQASEQLHRLGLNINVAKVRYCSKTEFEQYWAFVIMDRFESGQLLEGLTLLKKFCENDGFGRKSTVLKRAITLAAKAEGVDARWWRDWVREASVQEGLPLHLSREQLLSFVSLYDHPSSAFSQLIPIFLDQPFTQPKAVLLRVLETYKKSTSDKVRSLRDSALEQLEGLDDAVIGLCVRACRN